MSNPTTPLTAAELDEYDRFAETYARRSRIGIRPAELRRLVAMARRGLEREAWLAQHGEHLRSCTVWARQPGPCNCGLTLATTTSQTNAVG